jgi:hypothetical protein
MSFPVLSISGQPTNATVTCGSSPYTFSVQAAGSSGYTYLWQVSVNGGSTFTDCPEGRYYAGVTTATLTTTPEQKKWLRCIVGDACGATVTSSTAALLFPVLALSRQPANVTVTCGSSPYTFSVQATGSTGYTYLWQVSTDGGVNFYDCPESRYYAGVTTATLTTTPEQQKRLRCVVSDACGQTIISSVATLSFPVLSVTRPANITLPCGSSTWGTFSVVASGTTGYSYQWQVSVDGGVTFSDCIEGRYYAGTTTATLTTTPEQTKWLRCVVNDLCGTSVTSGTAAFIIQCP